MQVTSNSKLSAFMYSTVFTYDKKIAEGKTNKEALRALKSRISDAIYRQLVTDQQPTTR